MRQLNVCGSEPASPLPPSGPSAGWRIPDGADPAGHTSQAHGERCGICAPGSQSS